MGWKFWQKKTANAEGGRAQKLPKPKELPAGVGRYLVVDLKLDPDRVWALKSVASPREDNRHVFDIRVFDEAEAAARDVWVKNYTTLDDHPELIQFEGWYDKQSWKMEIRDLRSIRDAAA